MKHNSKLFFLIIYFLVSCGSQNIKTGDVKIKGGSGLNGTVITGSDNEINNYKQTVEIHNYYRDSIKQNNAHIDSIIRTIRSLESRLSVFNDEKLSKKKSKAIIAKTEILKKKADSILNIKAKHEMKLRLQASLMEDLEKRKSIRSYLEKENVKADSSKIENKIDSLKIENKTDKINSKLDSTNNLELPNTKTAKPKLLFLEYQKSIQQHASHINKNIRRYKDTISYLEIESKPYNDRMRLLQNSLRYAKQIQNTNSIIELEKKIDIISNFQNEIWKKISKHNLNKNYNEYLLSRNSKQVFNPSKITNTIYPKNGKEFLEALKSNTRIILNEKEYNISPNKVGQVLNHNISFYDYYGINNIQNVEIIGLSESETHIFSNITNLPVLMFSKIEGVKIQNIKLGHNGFLNKKDITCGPGGDVIQLADSYNVIIESVSMYGCGVRGLEFSNCGDIQILKSKIYDCTNGAAYIYGSYNISFEDCLFTDNLLESSSILDLSDSKNIYVNNSIITKNKMYPSDISDFFEIKVFSNLYDYSDVFVENTVISNNETNFFSTRLEAIKMNNVTDSNNIYSESKYKY